MNLTVDMMLDLKKYGFSFEEFEHECNPGMLFYYDNCEYVIGGKCDETPVPYKELIIAQKGQWLPDESYLMLWLQWKWNYNVTIEYIADERYFYSTAQNSAGEVFKGSGPDLLCCLYKLVLKLCKNKQMHRKNN